MILIMDIIVYNIHDLINTGSATEQLATSIWWW